VGSWQVSRTDYTEALVLLAKDDKDDSIVGEIIYLSVLICVPQYSVYSKLPSFLCNLCFEH